MNEVAALPTAPTQVRVPDWFTPTQLGRALGCPLSAILGATIEPRDRLPPDPRAILGTVLHQLVEDAAIGRVVVDAEPRAALRAHLERLLIEKAESLIGSGLAHYVPLRATLRFSEYLERVNRTL